MQWCPKAIPSLPEAREPGRADVYGIIFYDVRHPFVRRVLTDTAYWKALNARTGKRWTIYAYELNEKNEDESEEVVLQAMQQLGLESYHGQLPLIALLVARRSQPEDESVPCRVETIDEESTEKVYESIRGTLEIATQVITKIDKQNLKNTDLIFDLISEELDRRKLRRVASGIAQNTRMVSGAWSLFKIVAGLK